MRLEVVTHCWHYSRALLFQLSSLVLYPPQVVDVQLTVFFTEADANTVRVLEFIQAQQLATKVSIRPWRLEPDRITRRMIGRNLAALETKADWVWFTDCDYVFRSGCLDGVAKLRPDLAPLYFPRTAMANIAHEMGDSELLRVAHCNVVVDIDPSKYAPQTFRRAIGGIQLVSGTTARQHGYVSHSRYHQAKSSTWVPNHDDIWFRRTLNCSGTPIELSNLYRIRHSSRGGALLDGALEPRAHAQ